LKAFTELALTTSSGKKFQKLIWKLKTFAVIDFFQSIFAALDSGQVWLPLQIHPVMEEVLNCPHGICREDTCKFLLHLPLTFGMPGMVYIIASFLVPVCGIILVARC